MSEYQLVVREKLYLYGRRNKRDIIEPLMGLHQCEMATILASGGWK
jgi:hypothetical protein